MQGRGSKRLRIRPGEIDMKATYEVISTGSKGRIHTLPRYIGSNMKLGTSRIANNQSGNIYVSREISGHKLHPFIIDAQTSTSSPQVLIGNLE